MSPLQHVLHAVTKTVVCPWPFPHIYVRDVFPADFYARLDAEHATAPMTPLVQQGRVSKGYPDTRDVWALQSGCTPFFDQLNEVLIGGEFTSALLMQTFKRWWAKRFTPGVAVRAEVLVTRDRRTFALGPHTDSPTKAVSGIFYLPTPGQSGLGTSLYIPKDPAFRCPGGAHHTRDRFDRIWTASYRPNSFFAFYKTDNSFHGVEPVESVEPRRLLIYDVRVANARAK